MFSDIFGTFDFHTSSCGHLLYTFDQKSAFPKKIYLTKGLFHTIFRGRVTIYWHKR